MTAQTDLVALAASHCTTAIRLEERGCWAQAAWRWDRAAEAYDELGLADARGRCHAGSAACTGRLRPSAPTNIAALID